MSIKSSFLYKVGLIKSYYFWSPTETIYHLFDLCSCTSVLYEVLKLDNMTQPTHNLCPQMPKRYLCPCPAYIIDRLEVRKLTSRSCSSWISMGVFKKFQNQLLRTIQAMQILEGNIHCYFLFLPHARIIVKNSTYTCYPFCCWTVSFRDPNFWSYGNQQQQ